MRVTWVYITCSPGNVISINWPLTREEISSSMVQIILLPFFPPHASVEMGSCKTNQGQLIKALNPYMLNVSKQSAVTCILDQQWNACTSFSGDKSFRWLDRKIQLPATKTCLSTNFSQPWSLVFFPFQNKHAQVKHTNTHTHTHRRSNGDVTGRVCTAYGCHLQAALRMYRSVLPFGISLSICFHITCKL